MLAGRATFSFDILMDPLLFFLLCSFYVSKFFESRKDIGEWAIERKKRKKDRERARTPFNQIGMSCRSGRGVNRSNLAYSTRRWSQ